MKSIAGMKIIAEKIESAMSRSDGVMNIGRIVKGTFEV